MSLDSPIKKQSTKKMETIQSHKKPKSVFNKSQKIDLSTFKTYTDELSLISSYITESLPSIVDLPFQGTWLEILKGDRYYVFTTREGRLAVLDSKEKIVLRDIEVSQSSIWTVGLSGDEKFVYIAGANPVIKKYSFENLKLIKEFSGHTDEVNSVIVSVNDEWMISCSDDKDIRFWSLTGKAPDKVLYSHSGIVFCMDLSSNNVYVASGSGDRTALIYELACNETSENGRVIGKVQAGSTVWAVKISESNSFLVTGDAVGEIILWRFNSWEQIRSFREDDRVRSIDLSKDEGTMVTAGENCKVVVWHLYKKSEKPALVLLGHKKMIKSAFFTHDEQFIVSLADDTKAIRWKLPFFEDSIQINACDSDELVGVGDNIVGVSESEISIWDSMGNKTQSVSVEKSIKHVITPDNHLFLFAVTEELEDKFVYKMQEYDLAMPFTPLCELTFTTGEMTSVAISPEKNSDFRYLCVGQMYKIDTYIMRSDSLKKYNSQIYHEEEVCMLCLTPNNLFLFSAGSERVIKKIDMLKMANSSAKNVLNKITQYSEAVKGMACTANSKKIIVFTEKELLVWSIVQESLIKIVRLENINDKIVLSKSLPFFYLQSSTGLELWSFQDFDYKTKIDYEGLKTLAFFSQERKIAVVYGEKAEIHEAPLYSRYVKLVGNDVRGLSEHFFKYATGIINGKSEIYDDQFKDWIIMPFMMNIQHLYAYYNYDDYLKYAFVKDQAYTSADGSKVSNIGDAPYLKSINNHTPLSIALEQDFPECVKAALKCMKSRWFSNPYSLVTVSDSLIALNKSGIDGLQKLYDFSFRKHFFTNLPNFCSTAKLPIVMYSDSIEIDSEVMLGKDANTRDGTALTFDHSCFKVIMSLGSEEGIDFLESLIDCPNERVFETKFIRLFLQEKWKRARYIMYAQAALYVAHMITLAYYSSLKLGDKKILIIPATFNGCLLAYEGYQMFAGGLDYFKDIWNYVDLTRSFLFFAYAIMIWVNYFNNDTNFLALVILITWVRGITYFRVFDPTRYLINLIFEVVADIPAFLIIFFYTILAFSFIFYALDSTQTYYLTFVTTYSTTLNNPSYSGYNELQWLFFVIITLFNFIIMLNLLISILADTYERVNEQQVVADGQELASMIMEVELMMFWKKKDNEKQFIHVCRDESNDVHEGDRIILEKFKAMQVLFSDYENKMEDGIGRLEIVKQDIESDNSEIVEIIKAISQKHKLK